MRRVTGAVVLMGVAVSAVTGCVTVRGEAKPHRSAEAGPSQRDEVPPDDAGARPRMGRPTLREALSRPHPGPSRTSPVHAPVSSDAGGGRSAAATEAGIPSGSAPPAGGAEPPPAVRSPVVPQLPGGPEMCDLGRRYGGWAEDSIPEQACERAYGD